jgi:UPF0042 nucleotide-binding protein
MIGTSPMLLIISGLSGAGKSTALHTLEDTGFFCTDNLPAEMLTDWAARMQQNGNAAVCMDIRSSANPQEMIDSLADAREKHWRILYIDASDEILMRRFSTLRRKHPFARSESLRQSLEEERQTLAPLREMADLVIDSSNLNPYELADLVEHFWRSQSNSPAPERQDITLSVLSFSYQRGLPAEADMVIDMRFLPNPHYIPELAPLTGKDEAVQHYFAAQPLAGQAEERIRDWLTFIWPQLQRERKRYFTIAFGCSGGRHRSVYMAERLAAWIREQGLATPLLRHRELDGKRP